LVAVWDLVVTFKGTGSDVKSLSWKWQHQSFQRSVVPLVVHTLLLFPIFLTFIFQSRGGSFFGNLNDLSGDFQSDIDFHIASFVFFGCFVNISTDCGVFLVEKRPV